MQEENLGLLACCQGEGMLHGLLRRAGEIGGDEDVLELHRTPPLVPHMREMLACAATAASWARGWCSHASGPPRQEPRSTRVGLSAAVVTLICRKEDQIPANGVVKRRPFAIGGFRPSCSGSCTAGNSFTPSGPLSLETRAHRAGTGRKSRHC